MKKRLLLLKVTIAFVFTPFASFNLVVNQALAIGNFSQSCSKITLDGSRLSANCSRSNGSVRRASIDLDQYIQNNQGQLQWLPNGNFNHSCKNIRLVNNHRLRANCSRSDGTTTDTSIDLNDRIENKQGDLQYQ